MKDNCKQLAAQMYHSYADTIYSIANDLSHSSDFGCKNGTTKKGEEVRMRFYEKVRAILKYISGLPAAIAIVGFIGAAGSDFLGNISYLQITLQLTIFSCLMAASLAFYWFIK